MGDVPAGSGAGEERVEDGAGGGEVVGDGGHACFTGMVRWFLLICKGEFLAPPKRGETPQR